MGYRWASKRFRFVYLHLDIITSYIKRSSFPSKNFLCISMYMLQIGALVLIGRLVEANFFNRSVYYNTVSPQKKVYTFVEPSTQNWGGQMKSWGCAKPTIELVQMHPLLSLYSCWSLSTWLCRKWILSFGGDCRVCCIWIWLCVHLSFFGNPLCIDYTLKINCCKGNKKIVLCLLTNRKMKHIAVQLFAGVQLVGWNTPCVKNWTETLYHL